MPRQPRLDLAHVTQHVVQRGNDRYHRTGTLWEGRYKACPVDCTKCLLKLSFIDSVYADELDPSKNSRCNLFQADRSNA